MAGGGGAGLWGGAPLRSIVHFASDSRPFAPSRLSTTPTLSEALVKGVRAMCFFSRGRARLCKRRLPRAQTTVPPRSPCGPPSLLRVLALLLGEQTPRTCWRHSFRALSRAACIRCMLPVAMNSTLAGLVWGGQGRWVVRHFRTVWRGGWALASNSVAYVNVKTSSWLLWPRLAVSCCRLVSVGFAQRATTCVCERSVCVCVTTQLTLFCACSTSLRSTKKAGVVGKYGTRYGASLRKVVKKMEISQHAT
jgi:hypothetical protein